MPSVLDLAGKQFGRLTVLKRAENNRLGRCRWLCECECGTSKTVASAELQSGKTTSCGCFRLEQKPGLTHGLSDRQEYAIYRGMISRCENPKVKGYERYGGRGIKIDPVWRNDFTAFFSDVGARPTPEHSLERLDANGNYEPGNVIWSTKLAQANNKRKTRFVTYRGDRMALCDAVRLAGSVVHREAAWVRIRTGWSVDRAVETPRLHESHNSKSYSEGISA